MNVEQVDFVIIGAGIAGLRAAITLAGQGRVLVVTKEQLGESNTSYAQGGIAVAMSGAEDVAEHWQDTRVAGDGLVDREASRVLVEEGPARVEELLHWGTGFDRDTASGRLLLTREGAHSRNRILHANGDSTGAEIGRSLLQTARQTTNIELRAFTTLVDLLPDENGRICGVVLASQTGETYFVTARCVLLASGGAGQVYSDTTNPSVATGDGIAAAWRAGAAIADMEFLQFHPTAFSMPGAPHFLLSEALRGEGAWLRNDRGERFMERYHPLLELAQRDVVARAIAREGLPEVPGGELRPVYLDTRHVRGVDFPRRFPSISAFLETYGLRLGHDLIPIRPAAHYLMGGVETDLDGRTSLLGLFAAGEVACTGVHGANRLASNSLLEGLVFGARAAEAMLREAQPPVVAVRPLPVPCSVADAAIRRSSLQASMWKHAGLLRDATGLRQAAESIAELAETLQSSPVADVQNTDRATLELRNLLAVAGLIVRAAFARKESRGAHYRNDFPARDDEHFARHSLIVGDTPVVFATREL